MGRTGVVGRTRGHEGVLGVDRREALAGACRIARHSGIDAPQLAPEQAVLYCVEVRVRANIVRYINIHQHW